MLNGFLDWFEQHKMGVMGTLALHTLVLFVCTMLYMRTTPREDEVSDMRIEIISEPEAEELMQRILEEDAGAPQKVTNLTSNITAEARPSYNAQRLAERVEQELRDLEQSERERLEQERIERGEQVVMPELDPSKWDKERYMDKAAQPVKVEGATTVWHDLKDRVRGQGIPAYLCKNQGRVAIRVVVERDGSVRKAELDRSQSMNVDDCMLDQAISSAKQTRFNPSGSAPDQQSGTVYFLFMPQ